MDIRLETLDWDIESEIMTDWPQFAFCGATAKAAIISDIHGRIVNNAILWPNLTAFVTNYMETVAARKRDGYTLFREILQDWGNLLTLLNVG